MSLRSRLVLLSLAFAAAWTGASPASAQASASPFTWATRYDAAGRVAGTIAPDPDGGGSNPFEATRTSYDAAGRAVTVERGQLAAWQSEAVAPAAWSGFAVQTRSDIQYDGAGRKLRETLSIVPVGGGAPAVQAVTEYSYDPDGRLLCTAVRMNPAEFALVRDACAPGTPSATFGADRITSNSYDPAGQLVQTCKGVGTGEMAVESTRDYWPNGKLRTLIDANGNRAEMRYDEFDRLQCWILPSTSRPQAYNPATQATALASAGALGGDCLSGDFESYGYDANSSRTSFRKRDGSVLTFDYDALNRMSRKVVPERAGLTAAQTRDVYYQYDLRGLQTKARFDALDGEGVTTYYDGFGRPTTTLLNMGGFPRYLEYLHDPNGNRTRLVFAYPENVHFGFAYDEMDRIGLVHDHAGVGHIDDFVIRYWYKNEGPRHAAVRGAGLVGFTTVYYYDRLNRPEAIINDLPFPGADSSIGLSYNPANQIRQRGQNNDSYVWTGAYNVNRDYQRNGLNQYTQTLTGGTPSATFAYDANGNLVSDGSSSFVYDVENRLVSASGTKTASLVYDPLGRLFQVSSPATGTTQFLHDGDDLVAEYNGSGAVLRRYVHGPGPDEPVAVYEGASLGVANRRYMLPDERGSIAALVNADGSPSAINTYDEYGIPGAGNGGRFQYTGQAWLPELGMYHYKARLYSPTLGRFLQTDPVGYEDQTNLYAYVGNDPVNLTDPDGKRRFGWLIELLEAGERKIRSLGSAREAVEARRRGDNVKVEGGRQAARQVERAAARNPNNVLRHSGHPLKGGGRGSSHYQTKGKPGHTFYDAGAAILGGLVVVLDVLDQATNPLNDSGLSECQDLGACRNGVPLTPEEREQRYREERAALEEARRRAEEQKRRGGARF